MIDRLFHAWERHLAAVTSDRVVRRFEWGTEWLDGGKYPPTEAREIVNTWSAKAMEDTPRFFETPATDEYHLENELLSFPSALETPDPANNTVYARYQPAAPNITPKRAIVVLPHWNAGPEEHMSLSRLIAKFGISTLRLSLPYHDRRMPTDLHRADYIVSANVGRTLQVCRQAVLDARRAVHWLAAEGYERIGILGTSLGSCLAMLTAAHEPKITTAALNHISPYFADVVWEGLSTAHVRAGLDGKITLDHLRRLWLPISPGPYIERMRDKRILLVYARYDLSFPIRLSRQLVKEFQHRDIPHRVFVLPCGHYSTAFIPFNWMDGYALVQFLRTEL
jgi:dienelactone hydrolase